MSLIFISFCGPIVRRGNLRICQSCGFSYLPGKELDPDELFKHSWFEEKKENLNER